MKFWNICKPNKPFWKKYEDKCLCLLLAHSLFFIRTNNNSSAVSPHCCKCVAKQDLFQAHVEPEFKLDSSVLPIINLILQFHNDLLPPCVFLRAKQECLLKMLKPLSSPSWRSLAVIQGRKNCIPVYFISPLLIVCFNKLIVICASTLVVQEKDLISHIRLKVTTSTYCMIKKGKLTKAWHWFLIVFKKHTYFTAVTPFLFIFELIRKANV